MKWWRRWKAKHWDEERYPGSSGPGHVMMPGIYTPRLRRIAGRLGKQAEENPLGALVALAGLLGSIAAIIALVL